MLKLKFFFLVSLLSFSLQAEMSSAVEEKVIKTIDSYILNQLKEKNISPGRNIDDDTFLRRIYLDIAGRIPTIEEYMEFRTISGPNRRKIQIEKLLKSPAYVSHSHNYWMDALRAITYMKKTSGANYLLWIRNAIEKNLPYDQFVSKLVGSEGLYYEPDNGATGYYIRDSQMLMDSVSNTMQLFLGTSIVCAQCHDHPYNRYTQMDFYKLAAFIDGTKTNGRLMANGINTHLKGAEKNVGNLISKYFKGTFHGGHGKINLPSDYSYDDGKPNELINAGVPYGPAVNIDYTKEDKKDHGFKIKAIHGKTKPDFNGRVHLAKWITSPENPMFTKTIANRLWDRVFGAPLIGDLLDLKEDDMGVNPKLTAFIIKLMKVVKYDQKKFMSILYKTQAYQRQAAIPAKDKYYFQGPVLDRLKAEQIWDSLLSLQKADPEKGLLDLKILPIEKLFKNFRNMTDKEKVASLNAEFKKGKRNDIMSVIKTNKAIYLKNSRASTLKSPAGTGSFLDLFGQSTREIIDGFVKEATIPQMLHFMNNKANNTLPSSAPLIKRLKKMNSLSIKERIDLIYKAVLVRKPSTTEMLKVSQFMSTADLKEEDLIWALVNSTEFKLRK